MVKFSVYLNRHVFVMAYRATAVDQITSQTCNLGGLTVIITKTCLYNVDPLKPHFYIVKLGFTGVYTIFLISVQKYRLWVLVRTALLRQF